MIFASSPESWGELAHSGDAADAGAAYAGDSSARDGPRPPRSSRDRRGGQRTGRNAVMRWLMAVVVGVALLAATGDAGWAKADSSTLRGQYPWPDGNVGGPCADEFIVFHGLVHWVTHTTVDDTGGLHVTGEINFHDVKGVAETSGTRYRFISVNYIHANFTNGASTYQEQEDTARLISAGPGTT